MSLRQRETTEGGVCRFFNYEFVNKTVIIEEFLFMKHSKIKHIFFALGVVALLVGTGLFLWIENNFLAL
jgi:hypothetical protein